MNIEVFHRLKSVPPIVSIVLTQATRRKAEGGITTAVYEEQIRRLNREELEPKGLILMIRELPGGRTRCIIKEEATGAVWGLMDLDSQGIRDPDSCENGSIGLRGAVGLDLFTV